MPQAIRVLVVEDNPNDAELIIRELNRSGFAPEWHRVDTEKAYLEKLHADLAVIISDYQLPQFNGLRALELAKQHQPDVPFIIVSGTIGEELAVAAMKLGAADYLLKDRLARLGLSVTQVLEQSRLRLAHRLMDEAIRQAEARYRSIFQNAIEGLYQSTPDGRFITVNPAMARIFGYDSPNDLISHITNIEEQLYVDPARRAQFIEALQIAGSVTNFEIQAKRKDGSLIWIAEHTRAFRNEHGELYYEGILHDINERKLTDAALRKSEEEFRTLADNLPVVVVRYDRDLRIRYINAAVEATFKQPRSAIIGRKPTEIVNLTQGQLWETAIQEVFDSGNTELLEYDYQGRKGLRYVSARLVPEHNAAQEIHSVLAIVQDITNRKRAEEEVRRSEERYRSLALSTSQIVWTLDPQGNLTSITNIENTLGDEYDPFNWLISIHPDDRERVAKKFEEGLRHQVPFDVEYRQIHLDKTYHTYIANAVPIIEETGTVREWVGSSLDITERIRLEEQLRQSQKMEAIGQLAGGVAHDFNNLLTVIIGYSQLGKDVLDSSHPLYSKFEMIEKAGRSAASLTGQLLAFSRRQILQPIVFNLNDTVANIENMLRRLIGEDIELIIKLAADLGVVKADPGQIEQIIFNLAVNARDAMPQGGKLIIETHNADLDETYARNHIAVTTGAYVMLAISDTGAGIPKEIQERIFEPFFTTKETGKGTGLGLSTVYGIVKQTGGNIWVYSEVDKGTSFKIYLPRTPEASLTTKTQISAVDSLKGSETILLVEDEEMIRGLARIILESSGYIILEAKNAREALEVCQHYQGTIDLMITDVVMPGASGRELAETLKGLGYQMKVLYVSGYTENTIVHHGILDADIPFLQKPFTPDALTRKVKELLLNQAT
ncbi:MAG: PAS domain S-box protein [Acidobacteriota bacterium]